MFWLRNKKNIFLLHTLNVRPVTYILFQVLKKNVIENIVPIVVALKNLVNIFLYILISLYIYILCMYITPAMLAL